MNEDRQKALEALIEAHLKRQEARAQRVGERGPLLLPTPPERPENA